MATYIKTLKDINEDVILPKTTSSAVLMSDGSTSLETQLDNIVSVVNTFAASNTAAIVNITDTGEYYTSDNVENALQEVGSTLTGKSNTGHTHTEADITDFGVYEPADPTILKDADIGVVVQAYNSNIQSHIGSTSNPHSVTATQVGLGNVDNTSDANKPISNATQTALDGKLSLTGGTLTGALNGTSATLNGLLTTNGQIKFPATQNPSADANTLDDYEEGTWTPIYGGETTIGTTTYTSQYGYYTKIGNVVSAYCNIDFTNATGSGNPTIFGLPFNVSNKTVYYPISSSQISNFTKSSDSQIIAIGIQNSNRIVLYQIVGTSSAFNALTFDTSAALRINIVYFTDN